MTTVPAINTSLHAFHSVQWLEMAERAYDPYDFENDDYVESQAPMFNASFMEIFQNDFYEEDFRGFTTEDAFEYGSRRVNQFHLRQPDQETDKENVEPVSCQRARKRKADPSSWKRNARKIALAQGEATTDYKGRHIPARKTGPPCRCRRECFHKVNEGERRHILETINSMGDTTVQNMYLRGLVIGEEPKRLGAGGCKGVNKAEKERKRSLSYSYYVQTSDLKRIQVCREAFISIHGITETRMKTIRSKAAPTDMRGRHNNRPHKISEELKKQVKDHINSFPRQTSHYSREKNPNKRYLSPELSVNRMYQMYIYLHEPNVSHRNREIIRCKQENRHPIPPPIKPKVSLFYYRDIFNSEFNMGFGLPRTDTCTRCEALELALLSCSESDMAQLLEERRIHQEMGDAGYKSKKSDKEAAIKSWEGKSRTTGDDANSKDAVDMITFDLQQVLPAPHLHINIAFYLRQLSVYNCGVHNCVTNQGYMFVWDETTAKRGSSEIVSCLSKYLTEFKSGARSLVSYSDGCGGQNKNSTVISFFMELHRNGVYERIDHKYLERGHTFLENDTDFSQIEKRKRSAVVYLPEDWVEVIREANLRKPFIATAMQREDFLDWKTHAKDRYRPINRDKEGNRVLLRNVHWMNFGWGEEKDPESGKIVMKHHPDEVWVRYGFSKEEPWKKILVRRPVPADQATRPRQLYQSEILLKPKKVKDLKTLASDHVPEPQRQFYLRLSGNTGLPDDDSTDNEDLDD